MKVNFKIKLFLIMKKVISQEMDQKKKKCKQQRGYGTNFEKVH